MSLPWAVYSRVSRVGDRQDTLISPGLQADRATAYARARGLEVEVMPAELDVSGGRVARPILEEVLEGIESGRFAGVIVAQLDRLSRMDLSDALQTIERVEAAGGEVIAVAENFDAATPEGRLGRNVFLALGQMQLDRYKLQFAASKAQAVERGIWPIARVPYGYRKRADRRLEPDPEKAPAVRAAFEARAAGQPWRAVADGLGVGPSNAGKIVRSRTYLGEIVYGEWHNPTAHEPLVSASLWAAAQIRHPRPARGPGGPRALLRGLVRCAGCRGSMTPSSSRKGAYVERIYRCTPKRAGGRCAAPAIISQPKLDSYVEALALAQVDQLAISASDRTEAFEKAERAHAAAEAEVVAYQLSVKVAEIGPEAAAAGMRHRAKVAALAQEEVARARGADRVVPGITGSLVELWPGLSVEERAHVLGGALGVVWVRRGHGAAADRVRVIARGHEPILLGGRGRIELTPIDWVADLEGDIGVPGAHHLDQGAGGAGAG